MKENLKTNLKGKAINKTLGYNGTRYISICAMQGQTMKTKTIKLSLRLVEKPRLIEIEFSKKLKMTIILNIVEVVMTVIVIISILTSQTDRHGN